jgi:ATP-binding cassette subfamily B protein/subfamily B ATP-binding cassette protein MsbA
MSGEAPGRSRHGRTPFFWRYRPLMRYPAREIPRLLTIGVVTVASSLLVALQPLPLKLAVDNGFSHKPITGLPESVLSAVGLGDPSSRTIVVLAAIAMLLTTLLLSGTSNVLNWLWEVTGQRMAGTLMRDMHAKLASLSPLYYASRPVGDQLSRLNYDSQSIYTAISASLFAPAMSAFTCIAVGISAWRLSHTLTIVIFLLAPALASVSIYFGPRLRARAHSAREAQGAVVAFVTQVMHSLPVVQAFTSEDRNLAAFQSLTGAAVATTRRQEFTNALADSLGQLVTTLGTALVLVVGGTEVVNGSMTLGALLVFIAYSATLNGQAQSLLSIQRSLRGAEAGLDRVLEVLGAGDEVPEPVNPVEFPVMTGGSSLRFEHVAFGYEPGRPVLHDVTFDVTPGETIALVGRTGAGKSTLVSLIPRFFDPWDGHVVIDGVDLRDARVVDVRTRVAVVHQEPVLLPVSIADNIAYGRPSATRTEIEHAAIEAHAVEFITTLPDGYDTVVGERGATLSGGQRQRIAIARALLKNAPVLILDEPTSALDAESETLIVDAFARLSAHRTVLVIAHRLSTVRRADRIIVLDNGNIIETGNHQQLLDANGAYAHFHHLQLAGTIEA